MNDTDFYLQLHRALAALLMKNRFIRKLTHTGLSRGEVHILIEIHARGESSVKVLQPLLNIDQSSVSRLVKNLIHKKFVRSVSSEADRRSKLLRLTAAGSNAIEQIDKVAGGKFEQFASRLTKAEREELLEFFQRIADWYGQPSCPERAEESAVRLQQRRMSRAFGVLSSDIFGSGLSSSQWFVFQEICNSAYPLNNKILAEHQGLAPNSLSIILEKLLRLGYIKRNRAVHDSRHIELASSVAGERHVAAIEKKCADDLAHILAEYQPERRRTLLQIVLRYIGQETPHQPIALPNDFSIRKIQGKKNRDQARAFAVTELVQRGHAEFAPTRLIDDQSLVFGLYDGNDELQSVCEIQIGDAGCELSLLASNKDTSPNFAYLFMERIFETLRATREISELRLTFKPAVKLLRKAGMLEDRQKMAL